MCGETLAQCWPITDDGGPTLSQRLTVLATRCCLLLLVVRVAILTLCVPMAAISCCNTDT